MYFAASRAFMSVESNWRIVRPVAGGTAPLPGYVSGTQAATGLLLLELLDVIWQGLSRFDSAFVVQG
jgi:hypothetical protein